MTYPLLEMRGRLLLLLALVSTLPALAAPQVVRFEDGRQLEVAGAVETDGMAALTMTAGGVIELPASRIVNWKELGPPPPQPMTEPAGVEPAPPVADEPWRGVAGDYAPLIEAAAERHGLDPALLTSIALAESNLDPRAVSHKGACGLLQLMPATASRFGVVDPFDPRENIEGGARYLSWLLARFEGRQDLALAGYNAGEGTVDRYRGIPPYPETRSYVARVLAGAARLGP